MPSCTASVPNRERERYPRHPDGAARRWWSRSAACSCESLYCVLVCMYYPVAPSCSNAHMSFFWQVALVQMCAAYVDLLLWCPCLLPVQLERHGASSRSRELGLYLPCFSISTQGSTSSLLAHIYSGRSCDAILTAQAFPMTLSFTFIILLPDCNALSTFTRLCLAPVKC